MLSAIFDVCVSSIKVEIRTMCTCFESKISSYIRWPSVQEWSAMRGIWEKIPSAVGAVDGTSHRINRPQNEPQEQYFSGHRHCHVIHTQIIIDNHGTIVHVESGFLGHINDAQQFNLMTRIGPNLQLPFPENCHLLADRIYANRFPLLTAYKSVQIGRMEGPRLRKYRKFNSYLTCCRVSVEHSIARLKSYRAVSDVWRHPRHLLSRTVNICAGLVRRRKEIGLNY